MHWGFKYKTNPQQTNQMIHQKGMHLNHNLSVVYQQQHKIRNSNAYLSDVSNQYLHYIHRKKKELLRL